MKETAELKECEGGGREDKLVLRGLKFHGFHGGENKAGQEFLVDIDAWMDLLPAGQSDRFSDTIDSTEIYRVVKEIVEGPAQNLIESVAEQVAASTLSRYPQISAFRVKIGKPHVGALYGPLEGVEILRRRNHRAPPS